MNIKVMFEINFLLKTVAKYLHLRFTSIMLAMILIFAQDGVFSIKQSFHRIYAELNSIDKKNKHSHASQKAIKDQRSLPDSDVSLQYSELQSSCNVVC